MSSWLHFRSKCVSQVLRPPRRTSERSRLNVTIRLALLRVGAYVLAHSGRETHACLCNATSGLLMDTE
jgi:hypothetical protein